MSATFLTIKKPVSGRGFTLIETLLYMVLLALVMSVIVQILISIGGIYRNIKLTRELESSSTIAMENMLREIRNASSVVINDSVLGVNPGVLTIVGVDEDLNPYLITYRVSSGVIEVSKDGGAPEAITSSSGSVSYLSFTRVVNDNSEGVRIELEMSGILNSVSKSERFYGFSVLRGSY